MPDRRVMRAAGVLCVIAAAGALAPWLAPYDPAAQLDIVNLKNSAPSLSHWFGTDPYSRDILSRAVFGARTSLTVAALATLLATVLGCAWGVCAATASGRSQSQEAEMRLESTFRAEHAGAFVISQREAVPRGHVRNPGDMRRSQRTGERCIPYAFEAEQDGLGHTAVSLPGR